MALFYLYEPDYQTYGFFDDDGLTNVSWWDRDLASTFIPLFVLGGGDDAGISFLVDPDVFFVTQPTEIHAFPGFFANENIFYVPMSAMALTQPDQMLKNEIIRIR
jgi:hypothetical protein